MERLKFINSDGDELPCFKTQEVQYRICSECGSVKTKPELVPEQPEITEGTPHHIIKRVLNRLKEEYGYGIPSEIEESEGTEVAEFSERPLEADFSRTPRNGYKIPDYGNDRRGYSPQS